MTYKSREDKNKYSREYSARPEVKKHRKEYQKGWRLKHPGRWKKWMDENPQQKEIRRKRDHKKYMEVKYQVVYHYSKGTMECKCCKEKEIEFLTLDHINNDGAKERKEKGSWAKGVNFYKWLIKNKFPEGYQILCYNCNCSKGKLGYCPHDRKGVKNE